MMSFDAMPAAKISWTGEPVHVIGIGTGRGTPVGPSALGALNEAQVVIGAPHQIEAVAALVNFAHVEILSYPSPLHTVEALLSARHKQRIVILASGDPLFYGIGSYLLKIIGRNHLVFHPNVSSVQAACAKIGLDWQHLETISLHGRPIESIRAQLRANRIFAVLTDKNSDPVSLARELQINNFPESILWIAELIGHPTENIRRFSVQALLQATQKFHFDPLHVTFIEVQGDGGVLPEFPGIDDENFITDRPEQKGRGMISKREVRLNILSLLSPRAQEIGWDIGAGCGGVAVEWARWNPRGQVYAVERHAQRLSCLRQNQHKFGVVQNLFPIEGEAPQALAELPAPNAIFIGGSNGDLLNLLQICWQQLLDGGRLVVSALTQESLFQLQSFAQQNNMANTNIYWTEIQIARAEKLHNKTIMRPQLPVRLVRFCK